MTKDEMFDLEHAREPGQAVGVDDDGIDDPRATPSDSQTAPSASPPGRTGVVHGPLPWGAFAVVLVLLGLVVAGPPASDWQRGMVQRIATPTEQWFTELSAAPEQPAGMWRTQSALILAQSDRVHVLDATSGEERWHLEGKDLICAQGEPEGPVTCASGDGADAELLVLDPDGEGATREPHPDLVTAAAAGTDLFTITGDSGSLLLQRQDAEGSVVWSADASEPGFQPGLAAPWSPLAIAGDLLVGGLGTVHRVEDGTPEPHLFTADYPRPGDTTTEAWLLHDLNTGGYRYLTPDGALTDSVDRGHPFIYLDDNITSDVVMQRGDEQIRAYSQPGGELLWAWESDNRFGLLGRVDGMVLVQSEHRTVAVDERTGSQVWSQRLPQQPSLMLSDGRTLLMPSIDGGELVLTGIELSHGTVRFAEQSTADQQRQVVSWHAHDGDLAVVTDAGVSMWSLR